MVKKIILGFFITSLIMIGVFGLVGCDDDPLKSYKDLGKTEIQTYADAKGQDNYSTDDWAVICNTVATGKAAVDAAESKSAVDTAVMTAKNEINAVLMEEQKMSDFVLTISTEKTTLSQGEDFQVEMVFKNNSGETIEISHASSWILPFIAEWFEIESPLDIQLSMLEVDEVVEISFKVSCEMPKGQHELKATAAFSIRQFGAEKFVPAKQKTIKSNTIIIMVA